MRPNLSLETFAGALAVLGTGAIMAACGGGDEAKTPVNATDVSTPATDKASTSSGTASPTPAMTTTAAPTTADTSAAASAVAAPGGVAAPTTGTDKQLSGGAAPAPSTSSTSTKKAPAGGAQPAPATTAKKGGSSSCGAGTCSAKK